MALSQDIQKTIKKTARREQLMREEAEQKRLKTVLELQYVLDKLGDDDVRTDLKQGLSGVPILSEEATVPPIWTGSASTMSPGHRTSHTIGPIAKLGT